MRFWGKSLGRGLRAVILSVGLTLLMAGTAFCEKMSGPSVEKDPAGDFTWEMPGRFSIYDLQFGAARLKDKNWEFLGNSRSFNAGLYKDRLTLMVRFSYRASREDTSIKFIIKLPGSRQKEEQVQLPKREGRYTYLLTVHSPENFVGNGLVYLYYGFSMVDVLAFTIMPGT